MLSAKVKLSTFLSAMLLVANAIATPIYVLAPVYVDDVAIIQIAMPPGHLAGNMEIRVRDAFTTPAGATCADRSYLTTLKSVDADKRMLALLLTAQATNKRVVLHITDDPVYTAFPGRCSLVAVTLTQ